MEDVPSEWLGEADSVDKPEPEPIAVPPPRRARPALADRDTDALALEFGIAHGRLSVDGRTWSADRRVRRHRAQVQREREAERERDLADEMVQVRNVSAVFFKDGHSQWIWCLKLRVLTCFILFYVKLRVSTCFDLFYLFFI